MIRAAILFSLVTSAVRAGEIVTRDGGRPGWMVVSVTLEGVEIEQSGRRSVVGWHEILEIGGEFAEHAESYLDAGETAWRALNRLERGDAFGAEPLFEIVFERYRGVRGPTAAVVAEGLLRCRLRRDARASAVDAWLELSANIAAAPTRQPSWGVSSPALDVRTGLVPSLPPIWYEGPAARAFTERGDPMLVPVSDEPETEIAWAVRTLYTAAARFALGDPIDATATARATAIAARREGGALVSNMVLAQVGGEQERSLAREALAAELAPGVEPWRRAWGGLAIGRSLLRERGASDQRRGVLHLLMIHALMGDDQPYLAGLALADAAVGCDGLGDAHAAATLADELQRHYPNHPVLAVPALNHLRASGPGRDPTP